MKFKELLQKGLRKELEHREDTGEVSSPQDCQFCAMLLVPYCHGENLEDAPVSGNRVERSPFPFSRSRFILSFPSCISSNVTMSSLEVKRPFAFIMPGRGRVKLLRAKSHYVKFGLTRLRFSKFP